MAAKQQQWHRLQRWRWWRWCDDNHYKDVT